MKMVETRAVRVEAGLKNGLSSPFGGELSVAVPPNRLLRGAFVVV
jgi:hypothetical protein